ncbi:MAG: alpha/beta fold hydrolase [Holophagales bacterium]|nr:MAG: alpha/beta fold hydrolase [Holophagales bacterium]
MAWTSEEELRRRRRQRLLKGLLVGGAAIGIPALLNTMVARRARRLPQPSWGRLYRWAYRPGAIAFRRLGEGDPVVLLHAFGPGYDGTQWREVGEALAAEHTVLVPDLLGWGRSEKPGGPYDAELYVQLLIDFLREVVRQRAPVVAAGLPAAYAVQVAVDFPELVSGLALLGPLGIELHSDEPDLKDALIYRLLRLPVFGTSAMNLVTSRSGVANHFELDVFADPERIGSEIVDHHYRGAHEPGAQTALAAYLSGYLNHGVADAAERLAVPTWIGWGRTSLSPPVETADLWLHAVPQARLEIFERCGSLPHLERPEAVAACLADFLADLGERGERGH